MKLFESYSRTLLKGAGKEKENTAQNGEKVDKFSHYKEWQKSDGIMEILFSFVSDKGDLITQDENGVRIVLKEADLKKDLDYYEKKVGEKFAARSFFVKVVKVDEKENTIYVKSARGSQKEKQESIKSRIVGELHAELKKEHKPRVAGTVMKVSTEKATVDILGKGILGFCNKRDWSKNYCRHFKSHCHEHEVYEFDVVSVLPKKDNKPAAFLLSRKEISPDPWNSIPDEYLAPGAVITVRCVERPAQKTYWWGISELLDNIEVQADYTKKCGNIMVGAAYKCTVRVADREKHIFRVVPFALADNDVGTANAIRFLDPKHKVK